MGQKSAVGPIDGMIPSFYEGELAGSVLHDGRPVSELPTREKSVLFPLTEKKKILP